MSMTASVNAVADGFEGSSIFVLNFRVCLAGPVPWEHFHEPNAIWYPWWTFAVPMGLCNDRVCACACSCARFTDVGITLRR